MRVAIIGGGLAGLGVASSLTSLAVTAAATTATTAATKVVGSSSSSPSPSPGRHEKLHRPLQISRLTIFDKAPGPGLGGASAVSAGLMHPFSSKGGLIYKGLDGYHATLSLMRQIGYTDKIGGRSRDSSILRVCLKSEEFERWAQLEKLRPDLLQTLNKSESKHFISMKNKEFSGVVVGANEGTSGATKGEGNDDLCGAVHLKLGFTVNSQEYLKASWKFTQDALRSVDKTIETSWVQRDFSPGKGSLLDIDKDFDVIIMSCGAGLADTWSDLRSQQPDLPTFSALPFKYVRGKNYLYSAALPSSFTSTNTTSATLSTTSTTTGSQIDASVAAHHLTNETKSEYSRDDSSVKTTLLSGLYIVPQNGHPWLQLKERNNDIFHLERQKCYFIAGSTYDHILGEDSLSFENQPSRIQMKTIPNEEGDQMDQEFLRRLRSINPDLMALPTLQLEGSISGVRVVTKRCGLGRLPKIGHLFNNKYFIMTGLGSRGMIYHKLLADMLSSEIIRRSELNFDGCPVGGVDGENEFSNIPDELKFKLPRGCKPKAAE